MRISDWSSDVCSSDLNTGTVSAVSLTNAQNARIRGVEASVEAVAAKGLTVHGAVTYLDAKYTKFINTPILSGGFTPGRSEEHTSEPQSLMRNSYAVFCSQKTRRQTKSNT